jgi:glycosyltransferase involved in cell wall biosynthesis
MAAPSKWLIDKAQRSLLAPAVAEFVVIPNGVDLRIFHPFDKHEAKASLKLSQSSPVVLFVANGGSKNCWKDFDLMISAIRRVGNRARCKTTKVTFVVVGESGQPEQFDGVELRRMGIIKTAKEMASIYNAADIYFHAAKEDTFPNAIIESLACGTPVVASAVGGIPEQVRGYLAPTKTAGSLNAFDQEEATGILFPAGEEKDAVSALELLLADDVLRIRLGANAAVDASRRFNLEQQVLNYQSIYRKMLAASILHAKEN